MAKSLTEPFYVYRILGEMGETVYIGKGCGRRLQQQKRRFMSGGEILEYCKTDKQAFRRERELIAKYNPPLNKSPGGNGSVRGTRPNTEPGLYAGIARIARRLNGLEPEVQTFLRGMISDIANNHGKDKFAAALRRFNVEVSYI